jgi:membrane protease YdiL (CAAX protease family)
MQFVLAVAGTLVMAIVAAGTVCWLRAILTMAGGQPLVSWRPRQAVPWGILDWIGILGLYLVSLVVLSAALRQIGWLPEVTDQTKLTLADKGILVWLDSGVKLGLLAVAVPLVALRTGAGARDFGMWIRELAADLKLGLIGFVMLAPPVYAIQGVLVYFWKPSKHPLMEMFKDSPDPAFFAVLLLAAAVVAPIFEELVFRVLMQGFLEKWFSFRHSFVELVVGSPAKSPPPVAMSAADVPLPAEVIGPAAVVDDANPYAPSAITGEPALPAELGDNGLQSVLRGGAAWLPIGITSVIFALLHYSHGPDWVPLILLSCGMGYLYQRTHSLIPSLVVHTLLNSLSMFGLWIQVYALPQQGLGAGG